MSAEPWAVWDGQGQALAFARCWRWDVGSGPVRLLPRQEGKRRWQKNTISACCKGKFIDPKKKGAMRGGRFPKG